MQEQDGFNQENNQNDYIWNNFKEILTVFIEY